MYIVKDTGQTITHKGRTFRDKIDYSLFPLRKCEKCGDNILSAKTAVITLKDDVLSVECRLDYKEYKSVVCWDCRPPHSMNANSIQYNVIKFGLTEDQALNLIHNRNKSPFYKNNHDSYEEYRNFQSHVDFSEEKKKEVQIKQDEGRKRWAEKTGKEKVREIKDSSSLDFHIRKYGPELGPIKFEEKCDKTRGKLLTEIQTKEEMQEHLARFYQIFSEEDLKKWFHEKTKDKSIISTLNFIERKVLDKNSVPILFGKMIFDIEDLYDFFCMKKTKIFVEKRVMPNKKGYVYNASIDGNFLRSGKEISFYKLLEENSIKIISTNKSYPKSGRNFYDFLIDINGKQYYIEIVGNENANYKRKLLEREETYGSILIDQKYYDRFIEDASSGYIEKGKYHDW